MTSIDESKCELNNAKDCYGSHQEQKFASIEQVTTANPLIDLLSAIPAYH